MKPFWHVEDFHADNGTPELIEALKEMGVDHAVISYAPFKFKENSTQFEEDDFIYVGSINLAEEIMKNTFKRKSFWSTFPNYDCSIYLPQIGDLCLNGKDYIMLPFEDLVRNKWNIYRWLGEDSHVFIRPNAGYKEFTGAVVDLQNFDSQMKTWKQFTRPGSIVLISRPVNLVFEWRIICASYGDIKKPVAASLYKFKGEQNFVPNAPQKVLDLAQEIVHTLNAPDPMYCVDIAETKDGEYKVIEINAFSTSGHYKADKKKIIETANEIFEKIHS